jgi:hypothetical protein
VNLYNNEQKHDENVSSQLNQEEEEIVDEVEGLNVEFEESSNVCEDDCEEVVLWNLDSQ